MRTRTLRPVAIVLGAVLSLAAAHPAAAGGPVPIQATDCFGNPYFPTAPGMPTIGNVIYAKPGVDTFGTNGDDLIIGTSGPDRIYALLGDDVVCGGDGNDLIYSGVPTPDGEYTDRDHVDGENGSDEIHGGADQDVLRGGALDDVIWGDDESDTIYGGPGNDYILCNGGPADWADGGTHVVGGAPDVDGPLSGNGCENLYNVP
ncbi:calcium-binding protein [Dactylosporangium sp. CS-047395]|uniref:calcium-binding protein n=1 Tax=Dactylosporangium sp. CS-047395 TaxID=3239936 RepID=UPI003D926F65